eukprot:6201691-Pleurochrysis_carterae.AAC.3
MALVDHIRAKVSTSNCPKCARELTSDCAAVSFCQPQCVCCAFAGVRCAYLLASCGARLTEVSEKMILEGSSQRSAFELLARLRWAQQRARRSKLEYWLSESEGTSTADASLSKTQVAPRACSLWFWGLKEAKGGGRGT